MTVAINGWVNELSSNKALSTECYFENYNLGCESFYFDNCISSSMCDFCITGIITSDLYLMHNL